MGTLAAILEFNQFHPQAIVFILILLVLLFCSAMVSGSETALFSLSPSDLDTLRKNESRSGRSLLRLLENPDLVLATILIANNLVNICIVILSNNIIDRLVTFTGGTGWEFTVKIVLVTFILLLFGEIIPKIYSSYAPLKFSRIVSQPLTVMQKLLRPFSKLLIKSGGRLQESVSRNRQNISIDELSNAIEITENHSDEEKQMLSGIVSFVNTDVSEIMKLRPDIVGLDVTSDFEAVKKIVIKSGFSRIPVFTENIDNIEGILYVKDMLPYIAEEAGFAWQQHLRPAYFVPENKKISDLLEEFQSGKVHLAIVVDEYGATQGLVSLEDILEEIVGEITDESDIDEPTFYQKIDDSTYIFEGKTHLYDLERVLNLGEDYFEDLCGGSETIAGLMLELKRDFLKKGERVSSRGITFTVNALEGRRIDKVKVTLQGE